jgi:signal transduction histidine kinase
MRAAQPNIAIPAPFHSTLVVACAYVAVYVLLDWISYIHPIAPYAITPWNPPPGLSLALLLGLGLRYAPALLVAAVVAELTVRGSQATSIPELFAFASILAGGYAIIAAILQKVLRFDPRLSSVRDLLTFTVAAAAGSMVVAALYISAHIISGRFAWENFRDYALAFWVGDFIGILVTTPFLLVHMPRLMQRGWTFGAEAALQGLMIAAVLAVVFVTGDVQASKFFYLLFLPLIWICVRSGFEGATAALLATQVGLVVALQFAGYAADSMLEFQALMLALAVTAAFLGMAVTEWRQATHALEGREAELNRAMRAAAAAEMASALAHELNQPLTAASNYVQACDIMLRQNGAQQAALRPAIDKAWAELQRAGDVVHRLRDFYRGGEGRRERVQLSALFERSLQPLRGRLERHRIRLTSNFDGELPLVMVDRVQIEMVMHNLVANAIDSISDAASADRAIALSAQQDGRMVRISVEDTGGGVPGAIAGELFRTFTTSKPGGMGLGLAISRSIVESHGGRLSLDATSGRGARFVLTLPAVE